MLSVGGFASKRKCSLLVLCINTEMHCGTVSMQSAVSTTGRPGRACAQGVLDATHSLLTTSLDRQILKESSKESVLVQGLLLCEQFWQQLISKTRLLSCVNVVEC